MPLGRGSHFIFAGGKGRKTEFSFLIGDRSNLWNWLRCRGREDDHDGANKGSSILIQHFSDDPSFHLVRGGRRCLLVEISLNSGSLTISGYGPRRYTRCQKGHTNQPYFTEEKVSHWLPPCDEMEGWKGPRFPPFMRLIFALRILTRGWPSESLQRSEPIVLDRSP
jgi:hypothetical protein